MNCDPIIAKQFAPKVIPLIDNAKRSIDVVVFDWRWYPNDIASTAQKFNHAIVRAARRGVKVRAIVNSQAIAKPLKSVGIDVKHHISKHLLHLKMMIIDDDTVVTGSHNYSQSAFNLNYELSVILSEVGDIPEFNNFFKTLWQSQ